MREFAELAAFETTATPTSNAQFAANAFLLAQHIPGTCSLSRAFGLRSTLKKMHGLLKESDEDLIAALDSAGDCLFCQADILRRRVLLRLDQDRLPDALADAQLCCDIYQEQLDHRCGLGAALISLGQIVPPAEGVEHFSKAYRLTCPPERPKWGKVICPSIPSDKLRAGYHRTAFTNLTIALARTGDPENMRLAEARLPEIRAAYKPHRWKMSVEIAKLNWLEGQIAWLLYGDLDRAEGLHRRAFRGLLKYGTPVDVAQIYADLARLLEALGESELIVDLYVPPDPEQRPLMERQLRAMAPELLGLVDAVRDAAAAAGGEIVRRLLELREKTVELGAVPPLWDAA